MILRTYFTASPRVCGKRAVTLNVSLVNEMSEPVMLPCTLAMDILAADGVTSLGCLADQVTEELEPEGEAWHVQIRGIVPPDFGNVVHLRVAAHAHLEEFYTKYPVDRYVNILPCTSMPLHLEPAPDTKSCDYDDMEYCFRNFWLGSKIIRIREEICHTLTTGGRLWDGSIVLAEYLASCCSSQFRSRLFGKSVVEISCGCGLPGFVAAMLHEARVILTDRGDVLPHVRDIIAINPIRNGSVAAAELDWTMPDHICRVKRDFNYCMPFDVVLLADALYNPTMVDFLYDAIVSLSRVGTVVLWAHKHREIYCQKCKSCCQCYSTDEASFFGRIRGFLLPICRRLRSDFNIDILQGAGECPSNVILLSMLRVH